MFGKNAEHLGESCILYALALFVPLLDLYCLVSVRGRIREQKGIEGTCLKDLLCVWCCGPCALVQEARVRAGASNFAHVVFISLFLNIYRFFSLSPTVLCRSCNHLEAKAWLANELQCTCKIESV